MPPARQGTIALTDGGELRFEVRDDGAGFNGDVVPGAGLTNMRDRLAAVDATVVGTVVRGAARGASLSPWSAREG